MRHEVFCQELVGKTLGGRYAVERILGSGGMGVVAAGRHPELDQPVAIKFMWPEFAADDGLAMRFLHEAKIAAKVHSPHLVRVFDVGRLDSGVPYLVMEMLTGRDLDTELKERGPLPVDQAVDWFLQALVGLAEIHAAGIVHRDLKQSNLFLCETPSGPVVKVLDFGISKDTKQGAGLTATDAILGTPQYMSPEQIKSSKNVDARSDVWTLGVILYELLTGQLPFRSKSDAVGEVFGLVLFQEPEPPSAARPGLPLELEAAILRCLSKAPEDRFPTVSALANALRAFAPPSSSHRIESVRRTVPDDDPNPTPSSRRLPVASAVAKTLAVDSSRAILDTPRETPRPTTRGAPPAQERSTRWFVGAGVAAVLVAAAGLLVIRAATSGGGELESPVTADSTRTLAPPARQEAAAEAIAPLEPGTASPLSAPSSPSAKALRNAPPRKAATPRPTAPTEPAPLILDRK